MVVIFKRLHWTVVGRRGCYLRVERNGQTISVDPSWSTVTVGRINRENKQ